MKNAVLFVVLLLSAAPASVRIAGGDPGLCRPGTDSRFGGHECNVGTESLEDTTVIAYDDGTHQTWWCSDKDSFGAAVRFTPAGYPCYVVGARAEIGWDTASANAIYLRVFDDDGSGGLPGTVLCEEHRNDVPRGTKVGFRDYDLTSPVTIDSGDFYLCFWQKHYFNMYFGSDTHFDSIARQWWFFPDQGWVTPTGMDAADHLIRARVLYSTGVEADLKPLTYGRASVRSIVRGVLFLPPGAGGGDMTQSSSIGIVSQAALLDISGRKVLDLHPGANDVRALAPGVYFVKGANALTARKVVITR